MRSHAPSSPIDGNVPKAFQAPLLLLLGFFVLCTTYCMLVRLFYPYELDWIEGEVMCHVLRLLAGKTIYPPPSFEFVSEIYPPLYYYIVAAATKITGTGFIAGRVVSVLSCYAVAAIVYRIVIRESGRKNIAFIASALFLACYHVNGPWYDLARVDMFFFLLLLGGFFVLAYYRDTAWGLSAAGVLLLFACYTKQNALLYLPFAGLYLLVHDWRKALLFAVLLIFLLCSIFYALNVSSDGWFGKYTFFNLLGYKNNLTGFLPNAYYTLIEDIRVKLSTEIRYELCYKLPIFFTCLLAYASMRCATLKKLKGISLWEYAAVGGTLTYFMVRPHPGSEKNDFINLTLWGCILWGLLLSRTASYADTTIARKLGCALCVLLSAQLCLMLYSPAEDLPHKGSRESGDQFIDMVRNMPGEVFIPYHSFYAVMAGKKMMFNAGAFWGYQLLCPGEYEPMDIIEHIQQKDFTAIIIDDRSYYTWLGRRIAFNNVEMLLSSDEPLSRAIDENYQVTRRIAYSDIDEFRNPTGFMTRPEIILEPRSAP